MKKKERERHKGRGSENKTKQKAKQNGEWTKIKCIWRLFKILFIININHCGDGDIVLSQRSGLDRKKEDKYKHNTWIL